jgi:hypothetical protein
MNTFTTIPEFPNYEINQFGVVRNIKTKRILKSQLHKKRGYLKINLPNGNKPKTIDIHRLVGLVFIPNPNNFKYLDHIDRNRLNNNVENLRWCSADDNNLNRTDRKPTLIYCNVTNKFYVSSSSMNKIFDELDTAISHFKTLI